MGDEPTRRDERGRPAAGGSTGNEKGVQVEWGRTRGGGLISRVMGRVLRGGEEMGVWETGEIES